jgi:hypothetical protein
MHALHVLSAEVCMFFLLKSAAAALRQFHMRRHAAF